MICDNCRRFFTSGNRADGIPNGVKMVMGDKKSITLCANCLISVCEMNDREKDAFFRKLKDSAKGEGT